MSRFLKVCTDVQIFEQLLHATIANLNGPHRFVNCQLIASHHIDIKKRREDIICGYYFWRFFEDDRHVFLIKIQNSKFENF